MVQRLNIIAFFILIFSFALKSGANQCGHVLMDTELKINLKVDQIMALSEEVSSQVVTSDISIESINLLNEYFDRIDLNVAVQNISNKPLYYLPFSEDSRLNKLEMKTKDRMLRFIETKLFRSKEALLVAKYLTGVSIPDNTSLVARQLVNLKVEELTLREIKRLLVIHNRATSPYDKLSEEALMQFRAFASFGSVLSSQSSPVKAEHLRSFKRELRYGRHVNDLIIKMYEEVLFDQGFIPSPLDLR